MSNGLSKFNDIFRGLCKKVLQFNIVFILVGILGLTLASLMTFLIAIFETYQLGKLGYGMIFLHQHGHFNALICSILETTLIGVVLFICAIGLYNLFWKDINIPAWLHAKNVDELKERLVGIIITVLAVLFLEHIIEWEVGNAQGTLMMSLSIAVVAVVLVFYIKTLIAAIHHQD